MVRTAPSRSILRPSIEVWPRPIDTRSTEEPLTLASILRAAQVCAEGVNITTTATTRRPVAMPATVLKMRFSFMLDALPSMGGHPNT